MSDIAPLGSLADAPWPWVIAVVASGTALLGLARKFADSPVIGWLSKLVEWLGRKQYERENAETIMLRKDVAVLSERMERMEDRFVEQNREIEAHDGYSLYFMQWARDVRMMVASIIPPVALPDLLTFKQWREHRHFPE